MFKKSVFVLAVLVLSTLAIPSCVNAYTFTSATPLGTFGKGGSTHNTTPTYNVLLSYKGNCANNKTDVWINKGNNLTIKPTLKCYVNGKPSKRRLKDYKSTVLHMYAMDYYYTEKHFFEYDFIINTSKLDKGDYIICVNYESKYSTPCGHVVLHVL